MQILHGGCHTGKTIKRKALMQTHKYILHMVDGTTEEITAARFEQWRDKICFYPDEGFGDRVCEYPSTEWVFVEVKNGVLGAV